MRLGISGAHAVGKSSLAAELASALPGHELVDEPYFTLLDAGHIFGDPPIIDDYVAQLERSLADVHDTRTDLIFDRCPVDILAYLAVLQRSEMVTEKYWADVWKSTRSLDLIVYVPVERSDRVEVSASEYPRLRKRVDRQLRRLLIDDELGVSCSVLEVRGPVSARVLQVLAELKLHGIQSF